MDALLSIRAVTLCHAAMGAVLGALAGAALVLFAWRGAGAPIGALNDRWIFTLVVVASLSAWSAVGAGLSGFLLVNTERAEARRPAAAPGGRPDC